MKKLYPFFSLIVSVFLFINCSTDGKYLDDIQLNSSMNDIQAEKSLDDLKPGNAFVVGNEKFALKGLMIGYHENIAANQKSYPIELYFYRSQPTFIQNENEGEFNHIVDANAMIKFVINSKEHNCPSEGEYSSSEDNSIEFSCYNAQYASKYLNNYNIGNRIYDRFSIEPMNKPQVNIKVLDENLYKITFSGTHASGKKISGFYQGKINYFKVEQ